MDRLAPEVILLIAQQLYGSGTVPEIKAVSRFSRCNSTLHKFAAPFMYRTIPASRLRSPELLQTLKRNPKYGERVRAVTWVFSELQPTDEGPQLSNVMEQARIPFAILMYCHRVQRMAICLAAPREAAMLGGYNQPPLASQLCSLPALQSIKEVTIFNSETAVDSKPPGISSLYQFLCFLPRLEKLTTKDIALPQPDEFALFPSPSLSYFVFAIKNSTQIGSLYHLLSYSINTLTEFCVSSTIVSPLDLIQSLSNQAGERLRFEGVRTVKIMSFPMTGFVSAWEWNVFLNSFPNCERLILGFTGAQFQHVSYLQTLGAALTEARMGTALKEICIQTDLSLRAAHFYAIFRAARFCRNLTCLYLTANNYHMQELAQMMCGQNQEENQRTRAFQGVREFQDMARVLLRQELHLLEQWSVEYNLPWRLRLNCGNNAKIDFKCASLQVIENTA